MAIKIIKEGKKEFEHTCPYCGCVFTYEIEDLQVGNHLACPCCHKQLYIYHGFSIQNPPSSIPCGTGTETIPQDRKFWYDNQSIGTDPCENCDWHKRMLLSKEPYLGDSPCEWCRNGYRLTCTSTSNL